MINLLHNNKNQELKSVILKDNHLILSLTNIEDPILWRMSLTDIGTAVFTIKKDKKKSKLILKQKNGIEEIIASLDDYDHAKNILSKISEILIEPKQSKISFFKSGADENIEKIESKKWLIALFLVFIIIGLYWYLLSLIPENISGPNQVTAEINSSSQQNTGQPVSADEFLKGL